MHGCPFDLATDMTVEVFNEERQRHHDFMERLAAGDIHLLCNRCEKPVEDQAHVDFSSQPPMRQVICSACRWTGYRVA